MYAPIIWQETGPVKPQMPIYWQSPCAFDRTGEPPGEGNRTEIIARSIQHAGSGRPRAPGYCQILGIQDLTPGVFRRILGAYL